MSFRILIWHDMAIIWVAWCSMSILGCRFVMTRSLSVFGLWRTPVRRSWLMARRITRSKDWTPKQTASVFLFPTSDLPGFKQGLQACILPNGKYGKCSWFSNQRINEKNINQAESVAWNNERSAFVFSKDGWRYSQAKVEISGKNILFFFWLQAIRKSLKHGTQINWELQNCSSLAYDNFPYCSSVAYMICSLFRLPAYYINIYNYIYIYCIHVF